MKMPWKSAALFVILSGTVSALGVLGSVTYADVVRYHKWVDPASVVSAQLGQYYIIDDDGTVNDPLCDLLSEDFVPPIKPASLPGRSYVNHLGQLTPAVVQVVGALVPTPQTVNAGSGQGSHAHMLTFERIEVEAATVSALTRLTQRVLAGTAAGRLRACGTEITTSVKSGLTVCQVDELVRDGASGRTIGVGFATRCLATASEPRPRFTPAIPIGSFFSNLKHAMALIQVGPIT